MKPDGRMTGVEYYQALAEEDTSVEKAPLNTESPSCIANLTMNQTDCTITGLAASTRYDIYARSYSLVTEYGDKIYLLSVTTSEFDVRVDRGICLQRLFDYLISFCRGYASQRRSNCVCYRPLCCGPHLFHPFLHIHAKKEPKMSDVSKEIFLTEKFSSYRTLAGRTNRGNNNKNESP